VRSNLIILNGGASAKGGAATSHLRAVIDNGAEVSNFAPGATGATGTRGASAATAIALDVNDEEAAAQDMALEDVRRARMRGYEGESCVECGNFTLVRNGTCMKCDTCGSTSGCS
jgi:ribonucleoside-diphosphate reductase alpha chain